MSFVLPQAPRWLRCALLLLIPALADHAQAGVVIGGTRIIHEGARREVTVRLDNRNPHPALVQVWLDDGDSTVAPEDADVPFVVMPPVFRMEPGRSQSLRIQYTGEPLPGDRESLFWFNALEVAPRPDAGADGTAANYMQLAFRTRIKLFHRPASLSPGPAAARERISARMIDGAGHASVEITNPTPYHLSFSVLRVHRHAQVDEQAADVRGGMVAPMSTQRFALQSVPLQSTSEGGLSGDDAAVLVMDVIDDHGAHVTLRRALSR